jgi:hypothetical protein
MGHGMNAPQPTRWKYAKTYADVPHEYILKDSAPAVYAYYEEKLKTEGVKEPFTLRGRTNYYTYYYEGPYKYWVIPPVLNRCAQRAKQ